MKICRNCQKRKANRPRNLCNRCYNTPAVRAQYPPDRRRGSYSVIADRCDKQSLPAAPVLAAPGSAAKIQALAERALRGEALWHPEDGA